MPEKRRPRPVTDQDRQAIRDLVAAEPGISRNEIARRLNRGTRTIGDLCAEMGIKFDRSQTAAATAAAAVDAKARRIALIHRAYARAEKLYARLEADENSGFKFTTSTVNGIETATLDHVPGQEEKAIATAIGQHLTQAAKLEAVDGTPGEDDARSMLGKMMNGLTTLWNEQQQPAEGEGADAQ